MMKDDALDMNLLIVDDEETFATLLSERLSRKGFKVNVVHSIAEAIELLNKEQIDVILLDQSLPDGNGIEVLKKAKNIDPMIEVVMLTGFGSIDSAITALRQGTYDYLTKPCNVAKLEFTLHKAFEKRKLAQQAAGLSEALRRQSDSGLIIGQSPAIKRVIDMVERAADSNASVLITGESGTGKELVARSLHFWSSRSNYPFQALNSAALLPQLLESEIFGYEKGAFTGAVSTKLGLLEVADGGTLLLDEIGDMDLAIQAKFLRFLETGEFIRVGSTKVRKINVRVVTATNHELEKKVAEGQFREDLYYRLNVINIQVPPLRDRKEDIPLLAVHLLKTKLGSGQKKELSPEALISLQNYDFPGNIRELGNLIERGIILSPGTLIEPQHLVCLGTEKLRNNQENNYPIEGRLLTLAEVEKTHIQKIMMSVEGNKTQAAQILGIGLRTLYRKLEEYRMQKA